MENCCHSVGLVSLNELETAVMVNRQDPLMLVYLGQRVIVLLYSVYLGRFPRFGG